MNKRYLVDFVIPNKGQTVKTAEYREKLVNLGYNRYQAAGSIGGAVAGGSISILPEKIAKRR